MSAFLTKPFLKSRSVYDFWLDKKVLTIQDYDLILPNIDVPLRAGRYPIKRINPKAIDTCTSDVHRVKNLTATTMEEARKDATLVPVDEATFELDSTGQLTLCVHGRDLVFSSIAPLLLRVQYTVPLEGGGDHLLFTGAVQPTDYLAFKQYFDAKIIPPATLFKEIFFSTRSTKPYRVQYFDGSEAEPLGMPVRAAFIKGREMYETGPRAFSVHPGSSLRASYFTICATPIAGEELRLVEAHDWSENP